MTWERILLTAGLLTSCGGLGTVPAEFTSALQRKPLATPCRIELRGGEVTKLAVPIARDDLPDAIHRQVESIQPEGTWAAVYRVWTAGGTGYSVTKTYTDGSVGSRTVLIADDGTVIERSHERQVNDAPEAVLRLAARLGKGDISRVEVVHGDGVELFRIELRGADGSRGVLESDAEGVSFGYARVVGAEVGAGG